MHQTKYTTANLEQLNENLAAINCFAVYEVENPEDREPAGDNENPQYKDFRHIVHGRRISKPWKARQLGKKSKARAGGVNLAIAVDDPFCGSHGEPGSEERVAFYAKQAEQAVKLYEASFDAGEEYEGPGIFDN